MNQSGISPDFCPAVPVAIKKAEETGLPAGAICNPGLDAFDAAVYPDMAAEVKAEFNLTTAYFFNADLAGNIYYAQTPYQHSVNKQTAANVNEQVKNGTYVGND